MKGVREGTDKSEKRRGRGEKERERRRGRERERRYKKNVCYLSLALGHVTSDCQVTNEWSPAIERDL